jgi:hypothetical protein
VFEPPPALSACSCPDPYAGGELEKKMTEDRIKTIVSLERELVVNSGEFSQRFPRLAIALTENYAPNESDAVEAKDDPLGIVGSDPRTVFRVVGSCAGGVAGIGLTPGVRGSGGRKDEAEANRSDRVAKRR